MVLTIGKGDYMAYISSVAKGVPKHCINQADVKDFMYKHFSNKDSRMTRYLSVYDHAKIDQRQFVCPLEWYECQSSFEESNQIYMEKGLELSLQAIDECIHNFSNFNKHSESLSYEDIDMIVFVSSTGIATPSLDAHLINHRPFRNDVVRMPLWGLGCGGGAMGLARAFDYLKAHQTKTVLVICCELTSLTFQSEDTSPNNIVGTALFGDGVSATLLHGRMNKYVPYLGEYALRIERSHSYIKKHSIDVMGWDLRKNGLHVIFSKQIPKLIESVWKQHVELFLEEVNLTMDQIHTFIAHPGGRKVLEEMERVCRIPYEKLSYSYNVLQHHGNMSSVTVMYVLKKWLENYKHEKHEVYSLLSSLGPGFSSELLLLKWVKL